jgi:hypothetical protein
MSIINQQPEPALLCNAIEIGSLKSTNIKTNNSTATGTYDYCTVIQRKRLSTLYDSYILVCYRFIAHLSYLVKRREDYRHNPSAAKSVPLYILKLGRLLPYVQRTPKAALIATRAAGTMTVLTLLAPESEGGILLPASKPGFKQGPAKEPPDPE